MNSFKRSRAYSNDISFVYRKPHQVRTHIMDLITNLKAQKPMNTMELLSEVALFSYLGEPSGVGKDGLQFLTGAKIVCELYRRFTQKDRIIEALRLDATGKIVAYCAENPTASDDEKAAEVKKHIEDFAAKVALVQGSK